MNRQLTALGGVAIFLVILHHTIDLELVWLREAGVVLQSGWELYAMVALHRLGKVAVPLFLFISGGFIAYAARGNPPKLSWQTVQSAIRRLIWPYLFWSIAFYILVYFQKHESYDLVGYLKNLVVGYPFHFVPLLLFFYAIAVPLALIAKRFGVALIVGLVLYQLFLLVIVYPGIIDIDLPHWTHYLSPPILRTTMALWGIYFPLGLVFSLNIKQIQPWIRRFCWPLVAITLIFYLFDVLHTSSVVRAPMAVHIYPFTFVLLVPLIKRNWIPRVESFEFLGKRSYGLYLTHLLIIDLAFLLILYAAPWLFRYPLVVVFPVFVAALSIPLLMMFLLSATPTRNAHRYVFG